MSGNEKQPLVLRLRFPEFREAEEWKLEPLGKLAKRRTVKNVGLEHTRVLTNSAEFGVLDQRDYFEKDIANQGNLEGYYIVEKGDYVYNPRISASAPVGPISKNNVGTGVMSPLYTVFRFDSSDNDFFAHYFKSTHWHQYMRQASSTGARHDRMSITNDDFMGLPLPISKPEEQQKIADCLSSLDDLIAAETKKRDTLKTHKKGLMQQLFPREGETVPRLRFPEFRDAGEWKERLFGDLLDDIIDFRGRTPTKLGMEWGGGNIPALSANNVKNGFIDYNAECYLASEELHLRWMGDVNLEKEDIVFTMEAPLGNALLLPDSRKYILSQRVVAFKTKADVLNPFLVQTIWGDGFQNAIGKLATGSTAKGINQKSLRTISIRLPNKNEQRRIADSLSSLDDLITAQAQKIEALKTHKKGLMQQLFPVLDEVPA
ncbi:TPA: restriction endonuclease subunit S [Pseudomonas aeruginosa]|nr:restriction endonuclease subunit S [Pseudomonas aeruginosa]